MDSGLINTTWHCLGCVIPPEKKFAFTSEALVLDLSPLCIYILAQISKPPLCPVAKICGIQEDKTLLSCNDIRAENRSLFFEKKLNISNFLTVLFY
jgi:hypothetical protein